MVKKFNCLEAFIMKSNSLLTYFSPSMGPFSFNHFLFLLFWCSQRIDLRGMEVADRAVGFLKLNVRRGGRKRVEQEAETRQASMQLRERFLGEGSNSTEKPHGGGGSRTQTSASGQTN